MKHQYVIGIFANLLFAAGIASVGPDSAAAAEPKATHGDWLVYVEDGGKLCYAASVPTKDEGNYSKRGDIYILVSHQKADKSRNVVSIDMGYPLKQGSDVTLEAAGKTFKLYTSAQTEQTAWSYETDQNAIAAAIRAGTEMIVQGTSSRGTATRDTYSLKGSSAALDAIDKACK